MPKTENKKTVEISPSKIIGLISLSLVVVALLGGLVWTYLNYLDAKDQIALLSSKEGQEKILQAEIDTLLDQVGRHIVLPVGEEPMIATIEDVETLKQEEPFYEGATNGDKLLIFSKKAMIYNLAQDKLVNVGPVFMNESARENESAIPAASPAGEPVAEVVAPLTVDIRNGSSTVGLASKLANDFQVASADYIVGAVANAAKKDYTGTVLVSLTGKDVSALEERLAVKAVTELPAGEAPSTADALIILGN